MPRIKLESEADLLRTILDYLQKRRIFHWRQNTGAAKYEDDKRRKRFVRFGWPGLPDIIAVVNGRAIGIELKAIDGEQTQKQFAFQCGLEHAGGTYILARSLDEVIAGLR